MDRAATDALAMTEALQCLDAVVLARQPDGAFRLAAHPPAWWETRFGPVEDFRSRSLFLDDFLAHAAEPFWANGSGSPLRSGVWEEGDTHFEAIAAAGGLLLVQAADDRIGRERAIVQSAHDQRLDRRRLQKELEKKQILLDCIMHDLGNPLAAVLMNLQHIDGRLGRSDLQPAITRAIAQAGRQRQLIRSIAEVFAGDLIGAGARGTAEPVDLVDVAAKTVSACAPLAAEKSVTLCPFFTKLSPVFAEAFHLSRVIENLLVNAIRHSPTGGRVSLSFANDGPHALCGVEDEGDGIDPSVAGTLFAPFTQGPGPTGQSGLGLYFCRLTIEQWGGRIEGRNRTDRPGACFEIRLRHAK